MFNFNGHKPQPADWRGKLASLKALREKVREYSVNVPGIAPLLEREFSEEKARVIPEIQRGVIGEFKTAIDYYKARAKLRMDAEQAERARWDKVKLANELTGLQAMIEIILKSQDNPMSKEEGKGEELRTLYNEYMEGDIYQQRAAAEVYSRLLGKASNTSAKEEANRLEYAAKAKLEEVRTTDELNTAMANQGRAIEELMAAREELVKVGRDIGDDPMNVFSTGPITKAWKQVQVKNGDLFIFPEDSPEVSGVDWTHFEREETK